MSRTSAAPRSAGTAAGQAKRSGHREDSRILIGGRPVAMSTLERDVSRGWARFWARRGGIPGSAWDGSRRAQR